MSLLRLAIDRQNKALVSFNGSPTSIPALFQGNTQDFEITFVDPPTGLQGSYTKVDLGTDGLRVAIGDTPTGTPGGPTPLAIQTTWTWDSANKNFTASIALNTAAIDSFLGTAASKQAYFEVNVTTAGNRITTLQTTFPLDAVVDEQTSTAPTPTDQYLTKAEQLAAFVQYISANGKTIVLKSPSGIYGRELGVADDGSPIDNIITL
jgi:hypothetical protein